MKLVTRSELADEITKLTGTTVTLRQIQGNEFRWGLRDARKPLNKRVLRYDLGKSVEILRNRGIL